MSETILTFGAGRPLVGVLHRPEHEVSRSDLPVVLMLNAGILHRVGPNRLYVTAARELAQRGFHVLRFDLWGIGDSQDSGVSSGGGTFRDDTRAAMDEISRLLGTERFMLSGICMGAKIALDVASKDSRVESLMLMEGIYIKSAAYHVRRILDLNKWRRILTGESELVRKIRSRIFRRAAGKNQKAAAPATTSGGSRSVLLLEESDERHMKVKLQTVLARGTKVLLAFRNGNEISYNYRLRRTGDEITGTGLPSGLDVSFIPFADHTFTPVISQQLLMDVLVKWVEKAHPARNAGKVPLAAVQCG